MVRSEFGDGKESTRYGIIACGFVCAAALAISLKFAIVMAGLIAVGALLLGGKTLISGISARL
jgi:hypothetical protein